MNDKTTAFKRFEKDFVKREEKTLISYITFCAYVLPLPLRFCLIAPHFNKRSVTVNCQLCLFFLPSSLLHYTTSFNLFYCFISNKIQYIHEKVIFHFCFVIPALLTSFLKFMPISGEIFGMYGNTMEITA